MDPFMQMAVDDLSRQLAECKAELQVQTDRANEAEAAARTNYYEQHLAVLESRLQVQTERADSLEKVWAANETAYKTQLVDLEGARADDPARIESLSTALRDLLTAVDRRTLMSGKADLAHAIEAAERTLGSSTPSEQ